MPARQARNRWEEVWKDFARLLVTKNWHTAAKRTSDSRKKTRKTTGRKRAEKP